MAPLRSSDEPHRPAGVRARIYSEREASAQSASQLKLPAEATGVVACVLPEGLAGKRIKTTGKLEVEGTFTEVFVTIRSFDASDKQIFWINMLDASKPASDWRTFDKTLKLPSDCVHAGLVIHAQGTCSIWLDNAFCATKGALRAG